MRTQKLVSRLMVVACTALAMTFISTQAESSAQTATPPATNQAIKPKTTIRLPATLGPALDSKKRKAGEEVSIKAAASLDLPDGTTIPQGARIIGHITESKARSKGDSESSLGMTFEKIELAGGKTLPISGVMQAVGPNISGDTGSGGGVDYGNSLNRMTQHPQTASSPTAMPVLNGQSVGAIGLKGLELGNDGVLHSADKEAKLPNGAQILLRAQITN